MTTPFRIFEQFVQRLLDWVDRHPRIVRIIYVNPKEEARLLATGRVTLIRSAPPKEDLSIPGGDSGSVGERAG